MRGTKAALFVTGGGPSQKTFEPPSDLEAELFRTIQISIEGIDCELDSDAINSNYLNYFYYFVKTLSLKK